MRGHSIPPRRSTPAQVNHDFQTSHPRVRPRQKDGRGLWSLCSFLKSRDAQTSPISEYCTPTPNTAPSAPSLDRDPERKEELVWLTLRLSSSILLLASSSH